MDGDDKTSSQETARRNGDDGHVLLENEVVNDIRADDVEVLELSLYRRNL